MNKDLDPKTENVEILYSKEDFEKIGIEPEFEFTLSKITNFVKEEGKEGYMKKRLSSVNYSNFYSAG